MSDSKTGKEKLKDAAEKGEDIGTKLAGLGAVIIAASKFLGSFTKKD